MSVKYGNERDADLRRYEATFEGQYIIRNAKPEKTTVVVYFPFPSSADTLPDAWVEVDGREPEEAPVHPGGGDLATDSPAEAEAPDHGALPRPGHRGLRLLPSTTRSA